MDWTSSTAIPPHSRPRRVTARCGPMLTVGNEMALNCRACRSGELPKLFGRDGLTKLLGPRNGCGCSAPVPTESVDVGARSEDVSIRLNLCAVAGPMLVLHLKRRLIF